MTRKIRYKEPDANLARMAAPLLEPSHRASVGMDKFMGEYYFIHVDKIIPYKNQARSVFNEEEIIQLAETIKIHGVRQPLTILKSDQYEGQYEVVSGERRLRAAKIAGLQKVPCIIVENNKDVEEIALIENVQRSDLHPIDLAKGLKSLIDHYGWGGQTEIEKRIGISQSRISEALKLLNLSKEIQHLCVVENYTGRDNLLGLLKLENDEARKLKILGQKSDSSKKTSLSVLRIRIDNNAFGVQKNALKMLTPEKKQELAHILQDIIEEIS